MIGAGLAGSPLVAMVWASSGNLVTFATSITGFEWGIALVPRASGAQPVTEMFGSVNTMLKGTPEQQLAAWTFLKFMASADTQAQFAADTGYFPSERSSSQSATVQDAYQRVPRYKSAVESISPVMQLLPQSAALDQVRNHIATDDVMQVLLQKMTPEDGIKKLKYDADQALKQAAQ